MPVAAARAPVRALTLMVFQSFPCCVPWHLACSTELNVMGGGVADGSFRLRGGGSSRAGGWGRKMPGSGGDPVRSSGCHGP
ncbi:hypothetical protein PF010_g12249 [Phytophthora fragariae]|uniref:Uncharacterized protein n=1 Tax=Phytophthora fragariae TaxID=53985 RepID=A0A6G0L3C6_9STRA|nr:hypothetical protein PF010_g12249 [Phytophthora fragariae]KAE9225678.1 hypothetical protein PF004_g11871 [Phytophthora fragariae]